MKALSKRYCLGNMKDTNGEAVLQISKETTSKEVISIDGVPETIQRNQTINLSGARTNAVEFATEMFKLPTLDTLLDAFNAQSV